ncbi:MAG TPA: PAS domain-containing protein [bacterium]|mgnify:CR=1 FL=1|nr:PAS domain-containing protein [bacterium]
MLIASSLPFLGNLSYVSGINPIPGLDWTPVALLMTGALLFLLLIELRLFDLVPVARDTLIEKMGDALLVLDSNNRIVDINPEMERIINRSSGGGVRKDAADVLSRWPELYEKIRTQTDGDFEVTRTEETVKRTHDVRSKTLYDDRGRLIGSLIVMRDITRRKEMEDERDRLIHALEIANASKDRLFSVVAHDLRSPFNTLFGFVRVLKHRIHQLTPEKLIDLISELNLKTEQAFGLLENLLGWALSQTGGFVMNASTFSINKLIREILIQFSDVAEEKQIRIETQYGADDSIHADRDMMAVVLRNLLSNALKYTPENGRVAIETLKMPDTFHIQISDTGIGMDAGTLHDLFRIESVRTVPGTSGEKGSGLGLILCREFIERQGGRIEAESAKGQGSTFTVVLPVTPEDAV